MPRSVVTFEQAIADSDPREGGRTVLLGNGFSIAWKPEVFAYDSLYEEADLSGLTVDKDALFDRLATRDFELVIEHLKSAAALLGVYGGKGSMGKAMLADAKVVQNGLADVLAARHPHTSSDVTDAEVVSAREFLTNFGRIFTLSYDLLLYWVVNRYSNGAHVPRGDGFEWPTSAGGPLIWKRKAADRGQRVFWLHGALHFFVEEDRRLHKLRFITDGRLVDALRDKLLDGHYPLVVTEGKRAEKEARIERSGYLRYCHRQLAELRGSLFIHGMSLSPNDDHVLAAIEAKDNQVEALYVGIHGRPTTPAAQRVMDRARLVRERREEAGGRKLTIMFYDSNSANVWRDPS